jgi:hypothetical protein
VAKLKTLRNYKVDSRIASFVDSVEKYFNGPRLVDLEKLGKFFRFNDLLDESRCVKLEEYIPELEECRKYLRD